MISKRTWDSYPATYQAREVAIIADWIAAGESGAIVGAPGAGKSNLLGFLSRQPNVIKSHLPGDDLRLALALVDLNNLPGNDLSTFYRIILRALYESRIQLTTIEETLAGVIETLYRSVAKETDPFVTQSALREALFAFELHNTRLVLVLDPFDRMAQTAPPQILDNLRGLRDSFKSTLSYLVGLQQPLNYLRTPLELGELYTLLDTHLCWVGGMSASDAYFLINNVTKARGCNFSEAQIEQLMQLTGGYAALLKAAAWWLVRAGLPLSQTSWLEALLAEPGIQNRLRDLWQNLTGEEQLILAELQDLPASAHQTFGHQYSQILAWLKKKQVCHCSPEGYWRVFSPLLAAYIKQLGLIDTGKVHYRAVDDVILRGSRSLEQELTPQDRRLLLFLLAHPRKILGKDELVTALWSESEIYETERGVTDSRLQKAISQLRQILERGENSPCYIKTIHGHGYRFFPEGAPRG